MSHKGEKRRNYTMEFKWVTIEYSVENSNHKAAEKFVVFHAAKRKSKSLDEEFKSCCVVKSSGNA